MFGSYFWEQSKVIWFSFWLLFLAFLMAHMDKTQLPHQEAMCQGTEGILWIILCEQVILTNNLMNVLESGHLLIQLEMPTALADTLIVTFWKIH